MISLLVGDKEGMGLSKCNFNGRRGQPPDWSRFKMEQEQGN